MCGEQAAYQHHYTNAQRKFPPGVRVRAKSERRLLLDDPHPNFGLHVGVEANGYLVDAKRLDGLVKVDLSLLDLRKALRVQLLRDVRRGDRAEQLVLFADARGKGQRDLLRADSRASAPANGARFRPPRGAPSRARCACGCPESPRTPARGGEESFCRSRETPFTMSPGWPRLSIACLRITSMRSAPSNC